MVQRKATSNWSDQQVEQIIGQLLRWGVMIAAFVVLAGGILFLVRHGNEQLSFRVFHGEPADLTSVPGVVRFAASMHARGIIQLGLLLLILTPIARVAFSAVAFAIERDKMYVVYTLVVLAILIYSLSGHAP